MKRKISMLMAAALTAGAIVGCSAKQDKPEETTTQPQVQTETNTETNAENITTEPGTDLRTGMAVISSMESSKDAGAKDGNAQVDSVVAAIVLDADGKIVSCVLDTAQTKMGFTAEGKVVMADGFQSKKEAKDDYGMKAASSIGKEWYEQAEAMEDYVIGKTIEEVKGIAVDEDTKPTEADLAAGVTIKIGDYVEAIEAAAVNAQAIGTQAGDKLGIGIVTNMEKSKDASADKDGQCVAYSTYVVTTTDADGKITGSIIDETQSTVTFDATGKITSDLTAGVETKKQLGDAYGMKAASGIGKEWFEQAQAMEMYMIGKTSEEIAGIAVDEDSKPTDTDLTAGVTVSIGDFQAAVVKSAASAK